MNWYDHTNNWHESVMETNFVFSMTLGTIFIGSTKAFNLAAGNRMENDCDNIEMAKTFTIYILRIQLKTIILVCDELRRQRERK